MGVFILVVLFIFFFDSRDRGTFERASRYSVIHFAFEREHKQQQFFLIAFKTLPLLREYIYLKYNLNDNERILLLITVPLKNK